MQLSRTLALLALSFTLVSSAVNLEPFTSDDRDLVIEVVNREMGGAFSSSTRDAYYVASTFAALNVTSSMTSALCSQAKDQLTSPDLKPETAFFASNVLASLGCGGLDQVAVELVKKQLDRAATLPGAYYAISTLVLLKEHGLVSFGVLSSDTADEILINLKDLIHDDGSFRYKKTDPEGSVSAAGMVYEVLAGAKSLAPLGAAGEAAATEIVGTVGPLFGLAEERAEGMLEFIGEEVDGASANLLATARVLCGAAKLAAALEGHLDLPSEALSELAAFVLSSKVVLTTSDAFHLTSALAALAGPWLMQPMVISLATPALSPSAMTLEVHLTTVMGKPAPPCTLLLVSALQDGEQEDAIYRDVWLTPVETGFVMDFGSASPEMGVYELILKAVQTKSLASSTANLQLLVRAPAALSNVVLQVRDTDNDASSSAVPTTTAKFPEKAPDSLSLGKDQQLLLAFSLTSTSGKPFVPHQAMVRISRKAQEAQLPAYFLATPSSNKGFAIKAPVHDIKDQLGGHVSGVYTVALLLGDRGMENAVVYEVAEIKVDMPDEDELLMAPASKSIPLPELEHIFAESEPRPASWQSMLFTLLACAPFLLFLYGLHFHGANVRGMPKAMPPLLATLGFHSGIAAIFICYVMYWVCTSLLQALPLLAILGAFTACTGHKCLVSSIESRKHD